MSDDTSSASPGGPPDDVGGGNEAEASRHVIGQIVRRAQELAGSGDVTGAMRQLLEGLPGVGDSGPPEARDSLAALVLDLRSQLAPGIDSAADFVQHELELVRLLLALWHTRESAPGGRLSTDTWGMAVGVPELMGFFEPPQPPAGLSEQRAQVRQRRVELDGLTEQAVLAGRFLVPTFALAQRFGLDDTDLWLLMALAAPELEPAFDRAYRYAWQDYTKKLPDVGFLRDLLDRLPPHPHTVPERFEPDAPLVRHRLVKVSAPLDRPDCSLMHRHVALAAPVVAFLRGRAVLAPALAGVARLRWSQHTLDDLVLPSGVLGALERLYSDGGGPFPFKALLVGGRGAGKRSLAEGMAWRGSRQLLHISVHSLAADPRRAYELLTLAVRDARLHRALLYVDLRRAVADNNEVALHQAIASALAHTQDLPVILGARGVGSALFGEVGDLCELPITGFGTEELVQLWTRSLTARGQAVPEREVLVRAACQPGMTPGMVELAAAELQARQVAAGDEETKEDDLRQVVRNQVALGLAGIAQRVNTTMDWDDLVLPDETLDQLERVVVNLRYADQVFDQWGFGGRFPYGKGLSVLFAGPPGTGKTMAAGIIARDLGVDLFQGDLSQIVSKWIGETEKTLARIFDAAERSHAAILFDEADSLFGRRTEQRTSTDRYANLETNYLLQRVEHYEGLIILTTNFEENIDEAFRRRLRFSIHFPFPDAEARHRIWQVLIPPQAKLSRKVDWEALAEDFELSGGAIKNAVLRAAFSAAEDRKPIGHDHLVDSAIEEYRSLGKLVRD